MKYVIPAKAGIQYCGTVATLEENEPLPAQG